MTKLSRDWNRASGKFWIRACATGSLALLCHGSAQASLCRADNEDSTPVAKVEAVLSWTRTSTNEISGVVQLVPVDQAVCGNPAWLVKNSLDSDQQAGSGKIPGRRGDTRVDAILPEPVNLALAIFGVVFALPRARQWKTRRRHSSSAATHHH